MTRNKFGKSSWSDFDSGEDVNPMEGVANLADAMLVLAVGIMMALIVAWDVDVINTSPEVTSVTAEETVELTEQYDELDVVGGEGQTFDEYGLTEYGKVYIDEDGNLYLLE